MAQVAKQSRSPHLALVASSGEQAALPAVSGEHPVFTEAANVRFAAFAETLLNAGRAPKTVASYRSDWLGLVRWAAQDQGEPFHPDHLTSDLVERWRDALKTAGQRPATINRKLVFVKRFTAWDDALNSEDVDSIRAVEAVPQPPRRPRGLSQKDLERFLTILAREGAPRDLAIVHTLLETGLKVSELVALSIDNLTLRSRDGQVRVGDEGRTVSLGRMSRRALRRWLSSRGEDDEVALFTGERGRLSANAVQRVVRKFCRRAGVQASPTTLRHTFAATYLQAGLGGLNDLAEHLGHDCIETTRLYIVEHEASSR